MLGPGAEHNRLEHSYLPDRGRQLLHRLIVETMARLPRIWLHRCNVDLGKTGDREIDRDQCIQPPTQPALTCGHDAS